MSKTELSEQEPEWYTRLMVECPPRYHSPVDWSCYTTRYRYQTYCVVADLLGIVLMPWQRLGLAILSMPRCFELVMLVGRQQGKTTVFLIPLITELVMASGHTLVYSAQKGLDAIRKLEEELIPLMEEAGLDETTGFTY